jgi:hypothetical protein
MRCREFLLVQRLENANLEMDNIFNLGSAAFFQ